MRLLKRTVTLHDTEELDDDFRAWADQHLSLSSLLGVVDGVERIVENGSLCHLDVWGDSQRAIAR